MDSSLRTQPDASRHPAPRDRLLSRHPAPRDLRLPRRRFLAGAAGLTGVAVLGIDPGCARPCSPPRTVPRPRTRSPSGVASGDPDHRSVVLWTRLAPDPLDPAALPATGAVPVRWEVYSDERLRRSWPAASHVAAPAERALGARRGRRPAPRPLVLVPVPQRGDAHQPGGPDPHVPGAAATRPAGCGSRLVVVPALRDAASSPRTSTWPPTTSTSSSTPATTSTRARRRQPHRRAPPRRARGRRPRPATGNRHALYRTDPDLQAAHAAFPFVVTWDDHEVENNYADEVSQDADPGVGAFLHPAGRRLPGATGSTCRCARPAGPSGPDLQLYRRLAFGRLAERQRARHPPVPQRPGVRRRADIVPCGDWDDPARSLTGDEQERWLLDGLDRSRAGGTSSASRSSSPQRDTLVGEGKRLQHGRVGRLRPQPAAHHRRHRRPRRRERRRAHRRRAPPLRRRHQGELRRPGSPTIGSELVGTSITSGGDGNDDTKETAQGREPAHALLPQPARLRALRAGRHHRPAEFLTVPYVTTPGAPIAVDQSFSLEAGDPGLHT